MYEAILNAVDRNVKSRVVPSVTISVQVGNFRVSELCSNVWIPEQPPKYEHGQAHDVTVAL